MQLEPKGAAMGDVLADTAEVKGTVAKGVLADAVNAVVATEMYSRMRLEMRPREVGMTRARWRSRSPLWW